ncbi:hypothetical protein HanIR_Chr11g0540471 [Helianthus annuus]|nr:hypothetical protein HanIR_Chr11g0540471 [Helianthus annuus]
MLKVGHQVVKCVGKGTRENAASKTSRVPYVGRRDTPHHYVRERFPFVINVISPATKSLNAQT